MVYLYYTALGWGSSLFSAMPKTEASAKGVHFLMKVDIRAAVNSRIQGIQSALRAQLREKSIRYTNLIFENIVGLFDVPTH